VRRLALLPAALLAPALAAAAEEIVTVRVCEGVQERRW
jgi:hypothetical protein